MRRVDRAVWIAPCGLEGFGVGNQPRWRAAKELNASAQRANGRMGERVNPLRDAGDRATGQQAATFVG
jgi:hypothetical protein